MNYIELIKNTTNEELLILFKQAEVLNRCGTTNEQPLRDIIDNVGGTTATISVITAVWKECAERWADNMNNP